MPGVVFHAERFRRAVTKVSAEREVALAIFIDYFAFRKLTYPTLPVGQT